MMNLNMVMQIAAELAVLPFYPSEPEARLAIVRLIGKMATTESQVRWLVDRMTSGLYAKWEGPGELRAVFCMKFKPADGIEAVSQVYPEGLTSEQLNPGAKQLPAPQMRQIAGESEVTGQESKELVLACAVALPRFAEKLSPAWINIEPGESELQALIRVSLGFARPAQETRPATEAQIRSVREAQERGREKR